MGLPTYPELETAKRFHTRKQWQWMKDDYKALQSTTAQCAIMQCQHGKSKSFYIVWALLVWNWQGRSGWKSQPFAARRKRNVDCFCCFNLKMRMTAEKIFSMTWSRSTAFWNNLGDRTAVALPFYDIHFVLFSLLDWSHGPEERKNDREKEYCWQRKKNDFPLTLGKLISQKNMIHCNSKDLLGEHPSIKTKMSCRGELNKLLGMSICFFQLNPCSK